MKNKIFKGAKGPALKSLEATINKALEYDPSSQDSIGRLKNKVLEIECTSPSISFYVIFGAKIVHLEHHYQGTVDTALKGSALSLGSLSINGDQRVSFFDSGVTISGDQELLGQLQQLLENLDIDWETGLSDLIGDIPAQLIGQSLRSSVRWKKNILKRAVIGIIEFSQEEARLTPSLNEVIDFNEAIQHTRTEVERLAARINKIQNKMDDNFLHNNKCLQHTKDI
jgi:ubiquinone biosynthesis accessory factor UbiJ|tara:strand:- start:4994 stop:5671 length:678 start_codon:yes stop_codon:yes gene_type:complete